jgi:hypothetical protein
MLPVIGFHGWSLEPVDESGVPESGLAAQPMPNGRCDLFGFGMIHVRKWCCCDLVEVRVVAGLADFA